MPTFLENMQRIFSKQPMKLSRNGLGKTGGLDLDLELQRLAWKSHLKEHCPKSNFQRQRYHFPAVESRDVSNLVSKVNPILAKRPLSMRQARVDDNK
jgi:hypothetical protein